MRPWDRLNGSQEFTRWTPNAIKYWQARTPGDLQIMTAQPNRKTNNWKLARPHCYQSTKKHRDVEVARHEFSIFGNSVWTDCKIRFQNFSKHTIPASSRESDIGQHTVPKQPCSWHRSRQMRNPAEPHRWRNFLATICDQSGQDKSCLSHWLLRGQDAHLPNNDLLTAPGIKLSQQSTLTGDNKKYY